MLDQGVCVQITGGKKALWLREGSSCYNDPYAPRAVFFDDVVVDGSRRRPSSR